MFEKLRYGRQYGYEVLFKNQVPHVAGKPGVLVGEMGLPDHYEFEFYNHFMAHVFRYTLPSFIYPLVMADKGIGLIDPENPLAREPFKPRQLIDPQGSTTNRQGQPYVECDVQWKPPGMPKNPWDHGYFLYTGDGINGAADICDKIGAKIAGWYYGKLIPEKRVAWRSQLRKVFEESVASLAADFPQAEFRQVYYMQPETILQAVEELLSAGCQTILYQGINCPVYSDFEDYGYVLPLLHQAVKGRARVILVDQLGNQPGMRQAYLAILQDQLAELPPAASVYVILSAHGHPFKKETQDRRAPLYRKPLEEEVRRIMQERGGRWELAWSFDEYADEYWDPKNTRLDTYDAYRQGIQGGYEYILELPTDFPAENTDLMIFHAMKKFRAFAEYNMHQPVFYPDWEKPLVRVFHEGVTTGIYAGTPVGPYRKYVVEALVGSLRQALSA
jgi:protoheme ferro-lyase